MNRHRFLKVRLSDEEATAISARAAEAGMTVSDLVRFRVLNFRLRQTEADRERLRRLARIGSNVNQIARWANIHKSSGQALEVALWLNRLVQAVQGMVRDGGNSHAD
jgi:hypothetical protein